MFTITVTYDDFDGNERKETLYFNLNKTELLDLEVSYPGGLEAYSTKLTEAMDRKSLIDFIHDLMRRTYGVKDPTGKRFIKNDEVFNEFKESSAYDEIFLKLLTDDDFVFKFITAAMPKGEGAAPSRNDIKKRLEDIQNKSDYEIKKEDNGPAEIVDINKAKEAVVSTVTGE